MVVVVVVLFLAGSIPALSQVARGSIVGSVVDASGAVIPGVAVTITHIGTNQVRQVATNEQGNYEASLLPIGEYRIRAELAGFKTEVRQNVDLTVGDRLRADFQMVVGEIAETIEVSAEAPLLKTEDATMSAVMDQRKMVDLPLNGRDFTQLAYLIPGAFVPRENSHLGYRGGFTVSGVTERANQIMLDGVNNQGAGTHELSTPLIIDAIAEFRLQTNTYGAQYGTFAGGQVDAVSKGGSNEFHGNAFFFHRNDNLDARNFFDPWPVKNLPEFRRHQYGATVGGPFIKNKTFFFYAYQGQRQQQNLTATGTLPRPEFWRGDFSALLGARSPVQLKDPATGQPFAGNIIPANRLNGRSLKFHEFVPDPNLPGLTQNAVNSAIDNHDYRNQHAIKLEHHFSPNHNVGVSINTFKANFVEWFYAGRPFLADHRSVASKQTAYHIAVSYTWVMSNRVVNDFRGGMNRLKRYRFPIKFANRWFNDEIQVYGTIADRFPFSRGIPNVTFAGYEGIGSGAPESNRNQAWTMNDTLSITLGDHNLKTGFLYYRKGQNTYFGTNHRGNFQFSGAFSGDSFADFLLGYPITAGRTIPGLSDCYIVNHGNDPCGLDFHPWISSYDGFLQDDWKLSQRLTLNLGVRYEYNVPLIEKYGRMKTYDLAANDVRPGLKNSPLHPVDANNFAPRLGLAYRLTNDSKTVLRAGLGVFYGVDDICNCNLYTNNPPNFFNQTFNSSPTNIVMTMDNPYPVSPEEQFKTRAGLSIAGLDPKFRDDYYQTWNLSVQRELPRNMVVEATYEGKIGHGLTRAVNINQARPGTVGTVQSRRPIQPWANIVITESTGNSNYHAGLLKFEKRMNSGLSFLSSYAWSKMIDDGPDDSAGTVNGAQNELNRRAERGLSAFDTRHRLSLSYVYELPFGRGRRFASNATGLFGGIIGGWELSGITVMRSGLPFTAIISGDQSGTGQSKDRPNQIGDIMLPRSERTVTRWFRTEAFRVPDRGTFGNAGRNNLIGPGSRNFDISLSKRTRFGEAKMMELRFEFFNALNTPTFILPNAVANSSNFGRIFQASDARQIQLGAKVRF